MLSEMKEGSSFEAETKKMLVVSVYHVSKYI